MAVLAWNIPERTLLSSGTLVLSGEKRELLRLEEDKRIRNLQSEVDDLVQRSQRNFIREKGIPECVCEDTDD